MPVTKIINVSKSDEFEEVFDLFKSTDADEVILIFPKGSRLAKQEQYFEAIKKEADSAGRKVSIMTTDPLIARLASQNDFDILENSSPGRKKQRQGLPGPVDEPDELIDEPAADEEQSSEPTEENEREDEQLNEQLSEFEETPDTSGPSKGTDSEKPAEELTEDYSEPASDVMTASEEPEATLAAATSDYEPEENGQGRIIKDILPNFADRNLEVKREREQVFEVDIKNRIGERAGNRAGDIGKIWAEEEKRKKRNFLTVSAGKSGPRKFFRRVPLLLTLGAAVILILVLYVTLGNAQIIIRPQTQKLDFKLNVSASSAVTAVDLNFNQIPGQRFKDQKEKSGTFPATGMKDVVQKAGGKIIIYNKSSSAQRLVATTRFKASGGLIFRVPQTITVPPATGTGSTLVPGSVESAVYADKPGAEYNIAPTQFTIPGLEGTPKFNDFYAVSDKPMSGGIIGPAKVITEEDFAKAQESLTAEVKSEILKSLKGQSGELKILDTFAIKTEVSGTNAKVGDAAENLQISVKGSADTIAFREADVIELARESVSNKNGLDLLSKELTVNFNNPVPGADNTSLSFEAEVSGLGAAKLDKETMLKSVTGMGESSIREYFKGIKEVESARIILSPFWVRSIPDNPDKIRIDIETD
jgi:hypothetical protein